jgi:aminoglycoside phosphotransferase (APT) family kinase protein
MSAPITEALAAGIWRREFGTAPDRITRFPTGSCNFVYLAEQGGERFVLRVARPENGAQVASAAGWLSLLGGLGLPVSRVIRDGRAAEPPYLILDYLPGQDLGAVYPDLSRARKAGIVRDLVAAQNALDALPEHRRFGYLASYEDQGGHGSWRAVVEAHLDRSADWIRQGGIFDPEVVETVRRRLGDFDSYLAAIRPRPFLEDVSTRNVLVHEGRLAGIIDLDWLGFGDKLYVLGLTRMALLDAGQDTEYIDLWMDALDLDAAQRRAVHFYTLVFCVDFMGGLGMRFNKAEAPVVPEARRRWYREFFDLRLAEVVGGEQLD